MIDAAAFGSKEDDELFYNIINAKDTSKEIICFLIKQRDNAAAKGKTCDAGWEGKTCDAGWEGKTCDCDASRNKHDQYEVYWRTERN